MSKLTNTSCCTITGPCYDSKLALSCELAVWRSVGCLTDANAITFNQDAGNLTSLRARMQAEAAELATRATCYGALWAAGVSLQRDSYSCVLL
jgi:hypothetical protein